MKKGVNKAKKVQAYNMAMKLRRMVLQRDAGEANSVLRRRSCRKWPAIGVLLAGIAGVPGFGAQAQEQPTEKTRTVMVCPSKDTPIKSCKPYVCVEAKEEGQKCTPAGKEKKEKEMGTFGTLGVVFVVLAAFISGALLANSYINMRQAEKESKQKPEKTGA